MSGGSASSSQASTPASSAPAASSGGGVMDRMARMVGLGGSSTAAADKAAPAPKAKPAPSKTAKAKTDDKKPAKQTAGAGAIRPKSEPAEQQTAQAPASNPGVISGAQPTVPAGAFDNRFGAWR